MKVETDIIANISASPIRRAVIFVIMSIKAFRTDVIVFICDITMCFTSDWPINLHMRVTNWPNIFVDQCLFSDPDYQQHTSTGNVQFANKIQYTSMGQKSFHIKIFPYIHCISYETMIKKEFLLSHFWPDFHEIFSIKSRNKVSSSFGNCQKI